MFKNSVASIMGDFGKKISQLKVVQGNQNKAITKNTKVIKGLKDDNFLAQKEISAAQKAINALEQFVL
jgi:hypothetical protein